MQTASSTTHRTFPAQVNSAEKLNASETSRILSTLAGAPVMVLLAILILDWQGELHQGGSLRYMLLGLALGIPVLTKISRRDFEIVRPARSDWLLFLLLCYGLVGGTTAKLNDVEASMLPAIVPLSLGLIHLAVVRPIGRTRLVWIGRSLGWMGLTYCLLHLIAETGLVQALSLTAFRHEKAYVLVFATAAAVAFLPRVFGIAATTMALVSVAIFPAATYVLVGISILGFLVLTAAKQQVSRLFTMGPTLIAIVLVVAWVTASPVNLPRGLANYYKLVGKSNNLEFRLDLLAQATERIGDSPYWGSAFTSGTRFIGTNTQVVGAHSDLVELTVAGGALALLLFVGWLLLAVARARTGVGSLLALRHPRRMHPASRLTLVALLGIVSWFATAATNPIMSQYIPSAFLGAMYATAMVSWRAAPPQDPDVPSGSEECAR